MIERVCKVLIVVVLVVFCAPTALRAVQLVYPGPRCTDYRAWTREVEAQGHEIAGLAGARVHTFTPCDGHSRKVSVTIPLPTNTPCERVAGDLSALLTGSSTISRLGRLEMSCQGGDDHLLVSAPDTFRG